MQNYGVIASECFWQFENGEPQLHKSGRLTTLHVSNAAENGEPQLQNK